MAVSVFLLALGGCTPISETEFAETNPFPTASVHFEQNATDGDVEVVFKIKAEDEGLSELLVILRGLLHPRNRAGRVEY